MRIPRWLAERHRELAVDDVLDVPPGVVARARSSRAGWAAIVDGAGFAIEGERPADETERRLRRLDSLPDVVGPRMRLLVIGLNPSPTAAATGIGFARAGNRFWPAALAAGLVTRDRDPDHALTDHGMGFTDLVKRTTKQAAELDRAEFVAGVARVELLCRWLRPEACVVVGLMGWRAAVERGAVAGWQDTALGGRPVYLMPSTSGLNAATSLGELTAHLTAAARGPGSAPW